MVRRVIKPKDVFGWLRTTGPLGTIFEILPFLPGTSIFPTKSGGYGILLELEGQDADGLARVKLDEISRTCASATRILPENCVVYNYLVARELGPLPCPPHENPAIARQQSERAALLAATAGLKQYRLYLCIYSQGKPERTPKQHSRAKRRQLQGLVSGVALYCEILSSICGVRVQTAQETTAFFSYLRSFEDHFIRKQPLMTQDFAEKLSPCRVTIGPDSDFLRVGSRYVQMFSLLNRPCGTRPHLWRDVFRIRGEFVLCGIFRPLSHSVVRREVSAQENSAGDISGQASTAILQAIFPPHPNALPVRHASDIAAEKNVERLGGVLDSLDDQTYFGDYFLYGAAHAGSLDALQNVMPEFARVFQINGDALLLEEKDGALGAYLSLFPGNLAEAKRKHRLRSDHWADLAFLYRPFLGHLWSEDLRQPYTLVYETPWRTPFFYTPFYGGNGSSLYIGEPRRGKSLNVNVATFAEAQHGGFLFVLDMGDSYSATVRSLQGAFTVIGPQGPRLNPFRQPNSPQMIGTIALLVAGMLRKSGIVLQMGDAELIEKAVERVYLVPASIRRLSLCAQFLPEHLQMGMTKWTAGGKYGHIFDNLEDEFSLARHQALDFSRIKDPQYADLLELYAFWAFGLIREVIEDPENLGVPKTIVAEELWKRIEDEQMMEFCLGIAKGEAKNLARLVVVTHTIDDLGPFAGRIINACRVRFFLGGTFDREQYRAFFGLNDARLNALLTLTARNLCIQVAGEDGFFKPLILNLDPASYARATTTPLEKQERERLIAAHGFDEGMRKFTEGIGQKQQALVAAR